VIHGVRRCSDAATARPPRSPTKTPARVAGIITADLVVELRSPVRADTRTIVANTIPNRMAAGAVKAMKRFTLWTAPRCGQPVVDGSSAHSPRLGLRRRAVTCRRSYPHHRPPTRGRTRRTASAAMPGTRSQSALLANARSIRASEIQPCVFTRSAGMRKLMHGENRRLHVHIADGLVDRDQREPTSHEHRCKVKRGGGWHEPSKAGGRAEGTPR
jgi:hypothetical protein